LPDWLGNLTTLTTLDLRVNQLTVLPESLGKLTALTTLDLDGNPWRSPLLEISEHGTAAVKAYLTLVSESAAEMWVSKLLVVGEGAVGKTSLVKELAGRTFDPGEPTTHGINVEYLEFDHPDRPDVHMRLASWDFGGQDIYHATHQFFLTDRSLFLLLWNARQGWQQAKLEYWLDIIKARAPQSRIILVATHTEGRPVDLPLEGLRSSYPQIAVSTAVENSTGAGIGELRRKMAEEAAKLPMMGSRWPVTWVNGVEATAKCGLKHATPEDLYNLLAEAGVTDRNHQTYLLRALHLLGDILFFEEDEELCDVVILRPQWVDGYITKVLDSSEVAAKGGLLTRSHERELWADLDLALRDRFLVMMEKFDLSYRISDDPAVAGLIVECLPWDSPPYDEMWDDALTVPGTREIRLRYQFGTLPPGIPTWFVAREHRFTTGMQWRSGALLRQAGDPPGYGLIRAEYRHGTVDLAVRGPLPQYFFGTLKEGFEATLKRYPGLEYIKRVPCICAHGDDGKTPGQPCPNLYRYDLLTLRVERGKTEVECPFSLEDVNIAELLFGVAPAKLDQIMGELQTIGKHIDKSSEFLKAIRLDQKRADALCPSIFTLALAPSRIHLPGIYQLQLRLYCEQPGAFHATLGNPYSIKQSRQWLRTISPYLKVMLAVLKHASPLVGPVLGMTSELLAKQLSDDVNLMTQLVSELPDSLPDEPIRITDLHPTELAPLASELPGSFPDDAGRIGDLNPARLTPVLGELPGSLSSDQLRMEDLHSVRLDVDYRALYAVLKQVDPSEHWCGLSRINTPEGEILWLCRDHAQQYRR
jgi:hypothetical protein